MRPEQRRNLIPHYGALQSIATRDAEEAFKECIAGLQRDRDRFTPEHMDKMLTAKKAKSMTRYIVQSGIKDREVWSLLTQFYIREFERAFERVYEIGTALIDKDRTA